MSNYITVAQVKAFKVNGVATGVESSYTDAEIQAELDLVEAVIETLCNDIFYSKAETNLFDGNGHVRLFFPPRVPYRLLSTTSVIEYDTDGLTVLDTFVVDVDFKVYAHYLETARSYSGDSPRRRFGSGGRWPKGQENVAVTGSWGRASTPLEIQRATILLVLEQLLPESTGMDETSVKQVMWDDHTVTFGGGDKTGQSTGYVQTDRLIEGFVNYVDLFLAVPSDKQTYDSQMVVE